MRTGVTYRLRWREPPRPPPWLTPPPLSSPLLAAPGLKPSPAPPWAPLPPAPDTVGDGGAGHTHIPWTVPATRLRESAANAAGPTCATLRRGHFKCWSSSSACVGHTGASDADAVGLENSKAHHTFNHQHQMPLVTRCITHQRVNLGTGSSATSSLRAGVWGQPATSWDNNVEVQTKVLQALAIAIETLHSPATRSASNESSGWCQPCGDSSYRVPLAASTTGPHSKHSVRFHPSSSRGHAH